MIWKVSRESQHEESQHARKALDLHYHLAEHKSSSGRSAIAKEVPGRPAPRAATNDAHMAAMGF
jgi:hypothetical protein